MSKGANSQLDPMALAHMLAPLVLARVFTPDAPPRMSSATRYVIITAACIALIGAAIGATGVFLHLQESYGTETAAIATGLGLVGISALTAAAAFMGAEYRALKALMIKRTVFKKVEQTASSFMDELEAPIREYPKTAAALAAAAGFLAGDQMHDSVQEGTEHVKRALKDLANRYH